MKNKNDRAIIRVVVATGISSVVTQLLTIREFLTQFQGNEIVIALVLFNWLILGGLGITYLATVGLPIGEAAAAGEASNIITYGNILYAQFSVSDTISLSIASLIIMLLASLYPAWFAARLEPIDALRAV